MRHHPDKTCLEYLCSGLRNGCDTLAKTNNITTKECKNKLTARLQGNVVTELIEKEVQKGFVYGPFSEPPFKNYRVSPIGVAEGKYSKKKRLILDLSAPHSDHDISINGLIDRDKCSMSYIKIDDAIKIVTQYGKSTLLCKYDISDAFKIIPVKSYQWSLFCMKWKSSYYYYVRLSFGCRRSPIIVDTPSRVVCYIAEKNYKIKHILHLLDDFLTIDPPNYTAERTMPLMTMIFNRLSIPLATHKTLGPTTCLEYLGIIFDTEKLEARLPQDKVDRICEFIKII